MFSLGGSEILVLAFIALILFGNKNLPQTMKKMVKGLNEVKKVANEAQRSWVEVRDDLTRQVMLDEAEEQARKELAEIKNALVDKDEQGHKDPAASKEAEPEASVSSQESRSSEGLGAQSLPDIQPPSEGEIEVRTAIGLEHVHDDGVPHDDSRAAMAAEDNEQTSVGGPVPDEEPDHSSASQTQKHTEA